MLIDMAMLDGNYLLLRLLRRGRVAQGWLDLEVYPHHYRVWRLTVSP